MHRSCARARSPVYIRFGYEICFRCPQPTPMLLTLHAHYTRSSDLVRRDDMLTNPCVPLTLYRDGFGNWVTRLVAPAGQIRITTDAVISDSGAPDPVVPQAGQHPVESLPEETLVYLLGSRYCDTDNLTTSAWQLFGNTPPGWARAGRVRFRASAYQVRI
jgi:transglutaminase-like putative cysteine protease